MFISFLALTFFNIKIPNAFVGGDNYITLAKVTVKRGGRHFENA
ncbi:MAG: hypothetical protein ACPG5B_16780 [Chitinophagales bacterium]